jgi:hypothetical protein
MASEYLENMIYSDKRLLFHYERGQRKGKIDKVVAYLRKPCGPAPRIS